MEMCVATLDVAGKAAVLYSRNVRISRRGRLHP